MFSPSQNRKFPYFPMHLSYHWLSIHSTNPSKLPPFFHKHHRQFLVSIIIHNCITMKILHTHNTISHILLNLMPQHHLSHTRLTNPKTHTTILASCRNHEPISTSSSHCFKSSIFKMIMIAARLDHYCHTYKHLWHYHNHKDWKETNLKRQHIKLSMP